MRVIVEDDSSVDLTHSLKCLVMLGLWAKLRGTSENCPSRKKQTKTKNIEVRGDMISPACLQVHFRTMYLLSCYLFQIQLKEAKLRAGLSLELA